MRGNDSAADTVGRQALMRACAEASEAELEAALSALGGPTAAEELRPPQTGLVMLRGRIGGSGPSFNVGEATVTRAALRLETGGSVSPTARIAVRGSPRSSTPWARTPNAGRCSKRTWSRQ